MKFAVLSFDWSCTKQKGSRIKGSRATVLTPGLTKSQQLTSHVEHRFEAETKSADFHGIRFLHRIIDHLQPNPVILTELCIIICIQSSSLSYETKIYVKRSGVLSFFGGLQLAQVHLQLSLATSSCMATVISEYLFINLCHMQYCLLSLPPTQWYHPNTHTLNLSIHRGTFPRLHRLLHQRKKCSFIQYSSPF